MDEDEDEKAPELSGSRPAFNRGLHAGRREARRLVCRHADRAKEHKDSCRRQRIAGV